MLILLPILAVDEAIPVKAIFFIFMLIVWGVSNVAKAIKKGTQARSTLLAVEEPPLELTPKMELMPAVPTLVRGPRVVRMAGVRPPPLPPRSVSKKQPKPTVRVFEVPQPSTVAAAVAATEPTPRKKVLEKASTASELALLLRPQSLRHQWLLTEILSKPLALREEAHLKR